VSPSPSPDASQPESQGSNSPDDDMKAILDAVKKDGATK
jgi:hypothetical protein